jgi:CRISPR-associated protein Cas2
MLSGYRPMRLIVMFDLPSSTAAEKRSAHRFRMGLLDAGFGMLQFSIYHRLLPGKEAAEPYKKTLIPLIPQGGSVHFLMISDRQFASILTFFGRKQKPPEAPQEQLLLF